MTLLTDYGLEAGFVGALHAVAFSIAPDVPVIDLDHSIPPQDVRLGSLRLERMMRFTPPGVHVAVVDPGVGSDRRAVAIAAGERVFVGPDNGLLVAAARAVVGSRQQQPSAERAVVLENERYFLSGRNVTFDGRDIFVPVAAHLATGVELEDLGPPLPFTDLVELQAPVANVSADRRTAIVEVVQVDGFGNVQFSATSDTLAALELAPGSLVTLRPSSGARLTVPVGRTFTDVGIGEAVLLLDSDGQVALSVNGGRADALFDAEPWSTVTLEAAS